MFLKCSFKNIIVRNIRFAVVIFDSYNPEPTGSTNIRFIELHAFLNKNQ